MAKEQKSPETAKVTASGLMTTLAAAVKQKYPGARIEPMTREQLAEHHRRMAARSRLAPDEFLTVREVCRITRMSRSTLWRMERAGNFPKRVRRTDATVAWRASEVHAWIAARKAKTA